MTLYQSKLQKLPKKSKQTFKGNTFEVFEYEQENYDGTKETKEILIRPDAVGIIPVLDGEKILINYEQKIDRGEVINISGGRIEGNETSDHAALRELKEETGIVPQKLFFIAKDQVASKVLWDRYFYLSKGIHNISKQSLTPEEKIENKEISIDEFIEYVIDMKFLQPELFYKTLMKEGARKVKEMILNPEDYFEEIKFR